MPTQPIHLENRHRLRITLHPLGASWLSCQIPLAGETREILLGSADLAAMLAGGSYLGASIGRYAGRIAHACFGEHPLDANQPPHILHGGRQGFSRRLWHTRETGAQHAIFTLESPHGDQGFPGNLHAEAHYHLDEHNRLTLTYRAHTDAPTPCNLTNHAYFNLNGGDGDNGLDQHLQIAADHYQPVASDGIPSRPPQPVAGSGFDFRNPKAIARDYRHDPEQQPTGGYDHSYLLPHPGQPQLAARLQSADRRITLELHSDQPALHLYSGQYLAGTPKRHGGHYSANAGIALESQYPPDSPSHGRAILHPGDTYTHTIIYHFIY
ncbi:MAG: galactose-1-epimerase [Cardiobacteriaceae bacterium]|nr:galactose-1-epimerase [Cardiobacteriaceae bacterium]